MKTPGISLVKLSSIKWMTCEEFKGIGGLRRNGVKI